ncbi:hypothetical protein GCM10011519_27970 [Marmoricola endophyticus]|uniref:UspA domain-containing protein n=1 Tax=Marmoricola endophyticus TaxID=2040280 RepID=A0A917BQ32_9ACTN|nr:universal stress protein [Marmoricola endophyticus]GGF52405.1 hypothetical protein GCM10011519_27970 [Marmoricola endophyticus]
MSGNRTLVVGVEPQQSPTVVQAAAALAVRLGARLVCVHADAGRVVVGEEDGTEVTAPVDPDLEDTGPAAFPESLRERVEHALAVEGAAGEAREVAGEPGDALARVADLLDAEMIVVGTRRPGIRGAIGEFFEGSVAVHLSHRQHRPVLVVPQAPQVDGLLPWQEDR